MKLSPATIGTLVFTAIATAAFVWMAKRPAVDATAMNFGVPMQSSASSTAVITAPSKVDTPDETTPSTEPKADTPAPEVEEVTPAPKTDNAPEVQETVTGSVTTETTPAETTSTEAKSSETQTPAAEAESPVPEAGSPEKVDSAPEKVEEPSGTTSSSEEIVTSPEVVEGISKSVEKFLSDMAEPNQAGDVPVTTPSN